MTGPAVAERRRGRMRIAMAVRTVGFVGLGIMGGPMAANLVKAGFDVVGYNRSRGQGRPAGRGRWPRRGERGGGRPGP